MIWDAERQRWVALIAEGQRIGFWTSPNLREWTRVSEYVNTGLGILECPDLFQIRADDGTLRWVMGLSGNGYLTGAPSTYAYWTGSFDGTAFVPDAPDPQWLDHGFDWYGAVTWADPADSQQDRRLAVGWMNSWSYPYTTPTWAADGFNGTDSIVREIRLKRFGVGYSLVSQPIAGARRPGHLRHRPRHLPGRRRPPPAGLPRRRLPAGDRHQLGRSRQRRAAAAQVGRRHPARRRRHLRRRQLPEPRQHRQPRPVGREVGEPRAVRPGRRPRPPAHPRRPHDHRGLRRRRPLRPLEPGVRRPRRHRDRPVHLGRRATFSDVTDHRARERRAAAGPCAGRLRGRVLGNGMGCDRQLRRRRPDRLEQPRTRRQAGAGHLRGRRRPRDRDHHLAAVHDRSPVPARAPRRRRTILSASSPPPPSTCSSTAVPCAPPPATTRERSGRSGGISPTSQGSRRRFRCSTTRRVRGDTSSSTTSCSATRRTGSALRGDRATAGSVVLRIDPRVGERPA